MSFDWSIVVAYWPRFWSGTLLTLKYAAIAIVIAMVWGILIGALSFRKPKILGPIVRAYICFFRETPLLVQLYFLFYGVSRYVSVSAGMMGVIALVLNDGAFVAEIVRGGIISIDKGQFEGAMSIGMTHSQTMFKVIIPQVMRNILPSVSNEFVINIKDTSVLNVIGVTELYYMAGVIKRINLQTFQVYTVICVLYFILTFTVTRLLRLAEKKLAGSDSYTICGSGSDSQAEIHIREAQ